jgi:hypothetical protein
MGGLRNSSMHLLGSSHNNSNILNKKIIQRWKELCRYMGWWSTSSSSIPSLSWKDHLGLSVCGAVSLKSGPPPTTNNFLSTLQRLMYNLNTLLVEDWRELIK